MAAPTGTPTTADRVAGARAEAARFLRAQPPRLLVQWGLMALVVGLGIAGFVTWSRAQGFVLLYSDLELKDSARIVDHLDKSQVRYRLEEGGHAILVRSDQVATARMQLAEKGITARRLPVEELTAKMSPGMSVAAQDMLRRQVLQQELAQSIQTLGGVLTARVHLAPPEESVFLSERRPAKASVILELRAEASGQPFHANGIAFLVANAVEGLAPEDVSIVDAGGRMLWPIQSDPMAGGEGSIAELRRSHEAQVTEKALAMLSPVVGRDNVMVSASVELDADRWESSEESFAPPSGSAAGGEGSDGRGRRIERREATAARVRRLSVAVFVAEEAATPRDAQELRRFEAIIKDAVGYDEARGDRITVAAAVFQPKVVPPVLAVQEPPAGFASQVVTDPIFLGGTAFGVLALCTLAFASGRRTGRKSTLQRIEQEAPAFDRRAEAMQALRQWLATDPERVAQVLRGREGGR